MTLPQCAAVTAKSLSSPTPEPSRGPDEAAEQLCQQQGTAGPPAAPQSHSLQLLHAPPGTVLAPCPSPCPAPCPTSCPASCPASLTDLKLAARPSAAAALVPAKPEADPWLATCLAWLQLLKWTSNSATSHQLHCCQSTGHRQPPAEPLPAGQAYVHQGHVAREDLDVAHPDNTHVCV